MSPGGANLARMIPELVAHRGWTRRYVENTASALEAALEVGAAYVEVDVQLSSDRVPFLFHDRDLERICGVAGPLHGRPAAALADLRAADRERFGERFRDEPLAGLPGLVELLGRYPDRHAFVELKRSSIEVFGPDGMLDAVLPLLEPVAERCTLISFDVPVLHRARARGVRAVGPILEHWDQRADESVHSLAPQVVFCNVLRLPGEGALDVPGGRLAVYEVDDPGLALELGRRGVALVETFAVGELLAALSDAREPS